MVIQNPLPPVDWTKLASRFTHIALSDEYLAIAATNNVLVFGVSREQTGRWVFCDRIGHGMVRSLAFSRHGTKLVALYQLDKKREQPSEAARFYSTGEFQSELGAPGQVKCLPGVSHSEVTWQITPIYESRHVAFSWRGDMMAIATTHSADGKACIRMLGESATSRGEWSYWGEKFIRVNNPQRRREIGVTGLLLYSPWFNCI